MSASEPTNYADVASAIAAWLAFGVSILSFMISRQAHHLAKRAEERNSPLFSLYLENGYAKTSAEGTAKIYAFLISVTNRSASNNSISTIDLSLTYTSPTRTELTLKIRTDSKLSSEFPPTQNLLNPPIRIDAHQTTSGWCFFKLDRSILNGGKVDKHIIIVSDSYGNEAKIEPLIVQEYGHETLAKK